MTRYRLGFIKKISALGLIMLMVSAQACVSLPKKIDLAPEITADVAEMAENGLEMPVMAFDWAYYHDGSHIKIKGVVRNNTGQPQQAVTLYVDVFSERGEHLGTASSFVGPTYLPAGGEGSFDVTIMPLGKREAVNLRLVTSARVLR